uniref:Uncharacterized protein n=1 Tax=Ditylum brightwellii TaxID=49249 RepID=A0A7S4SAQ1_9STRA
MAASVITCVIFVFATIVTTTADATTLLALTISPFPPSGQSIRLRASSQSPTGNVPLTATTDVTFVEKQSRHTHHAQSQQYNEILSCKKQQMQQQRNMNRLQYTLLMSSSSSDEIEKASIKDKNEINEHQQQKEQEELPIFDSLENVLNRARKRNRLPFLLGRLTSPIQIPSFPSTSFSLTSVIVISPLDLLLVVTSIFLIDAKGFGIGYMTGKATVKLLQQSPFLPNEFLQRNLLPSNVGQANLYQLWPVILAILFDQLLF